MTDEGRKTLDVLIPVYRPEAKLGHLLHMLNRQRHLPEKIVLMVTVDDGEGGVGPLLGRWISESRIPVECHVLSKEEFDHGGTRNAGVGFCGSE